MQYRKRCQKRRSPCVRVRVCCPQKESANGCNNFRRELSENAKGAMSDLPKLLLVDDRPENLLALEGLLRRGDAEILSAESGKRALEFLLEHEVALALIDVQMPELDGFHLAELMRTWSVRARSPSSS